MVKCHLMVVVYKLSWNGKGSSNGCGINGSRHTSILFDRLIQYFVVFKKLNTYFILVYYYYYF